MMKKKEILILMILLIIGRYGFSQSITVQYKKLKIDSTQTSLNQIENKEQRKKIKKILLRPRYYLLKYMNGTSIYKENTDKINNTGISDELQDSRITILSPDSKGTGLYKNFKTKEYINSTTILTKPFLIVDTLQIPNWEITSETKEIGSYKTKKATAIIDGKKVIAWYSDEIPISDGPADYYGLPGLILRVKDEDNTYEAIKISTEKEFEIVKPTKGKKVNRDEFRKIEKQKMEALKKNPSSFGF